MKLYEIPKDSIIHIECSDGSEWVRFKRIDGMYSVCITERENVIHLGANTELDAIARNEYIIRGNNE